MIKFKPLVLLYLILIIFASLSCIQAEDVNETSKISLDNETFSNLENIISNVSENSTISLNKNYTSTGSEITINKSLTIDGKGYTLNGKNTSRILYIQSSNVVVKNINFINGKSEDNGGANNNAHNEGGAVYGSFSNNAKFINCTFINNYATNGGSFNWFLGSYCVLDNCSFFDNNADYGGAIFFNAFDGSLINSVFSNNTAEIYGGSIFWNGYNGNISNCNFLNNSASVGGAVYWFEEEGILISCNFTNNTAENGGSVCWDGFKGTLTNCNFLNNTANEGGAIFWTGEKGILIKCNFTNNLAKTNAGAIWWDEEAINGMISNCTFLNNLPNDVADFSLKLQTAITASNVKTTYGSGKLNIILRNSNGNLIKGEYVEISLNSKYYNLKTDSNGQITLALNTLSAGSYGVSCVFEGSDKYKSTSKFLLVVVKKATPKLTAKAKTFKKSVKVKKYSVTLKTNLNKAMKNVKVTIKVNKKTYTAKSNSKGVATFKITKLNKKGKFKSTVMFKGNKNYNKKTKKVYIKVK